MQYGIRIPPLSAVSARGMTQSRWMTQSVCAVLSVLLLLQAGRVMSNAPLHLHPIETTHCNLTTQTPVSVTITDDNLLTNHSLKWEFWPEQSHVVVTPYFRTACQLVNSRDMTYTQLWTCPRDIAMWNVTVRLCQVHNLSNPDTCEECVGAVWANFSVSASSSVSITHEPPISGCSSTVKRSVMELRVTLHNSVPAPGDKQNFTFRFYFFKKSSDKDGYKLHPEYNQTISSHKDIVNLTHLWTCGGGLWGDSDVGSWSLLVVVDVQVPAGQRGLEEVRDCVVATGTVMLDVSKYVAAVTADSSTVVCPKDRQSVSTSFNSWVKPYPLFGALTLNWTVGAGQENSKDVMCNIFTSNCTNKLTVEWSCPDMYGPQKVTVYFYSTLSKELLMQSETNVNVVATPSVNISRFQNSHGVTRKSNPFAAGEVHLDASLFFTNLGGDIINFTLPLYFLYNYVWHFGDNSSSVSNHSSVKHIYKTIGEFHPSVAINVTLNNSGTALVAQAHGKEMVNAIASVAGVFVKGQAELQENDIVNFTITCEMSNSDVEQPSQVCFSLYGMYTNSTDHVNKTCGTFRDFNHTMLFTHQFNVSGGYYLRVTCENNVSWKDVLREIYVKDAPTPVHIPVASYTVPVVMATLIFIFGVSAFMYMVYRRHKNRHIQVADFDYLNDWNDPDTRRSSLKYKVGKLCPCLPGPWLWDRSRQDERYLALGMKTTDDYGSTHSLSGTF